MPLLACSKYALNIADRIADHCTVLTAVLTVAELWQNYHARLVLTGSFTSSDSSVSD